MRVVFAARANLFERRGGDTVQILKTKEHLEAIFGLEVIVCLDPDLLPDFAPVDIVHVFNLQTTEVTLQFVNAARQMGAKVALSTIYWNLLPAAFVDNLRTRSPSSFLGYVPLMEPVWRVIFQGRRYKKGFLGAEYVRQKREIVEACDLLLPNSPEELMTVCTDTGLPHAVLDQRTVVVPNAVEITSAAMLDSPNHPANDVAVRSSVAVVGRIEPIKNQLAVIEALSRTPEVEVIIIGRKSNDPKHQKYCDAVVAAAEQRGNVRFIDEIPHDQVHALLKTVKVHVLASFRESPGLSTLEALYAGCNIVTASSPYCPIDYYAFNRLGAQCNPFSMSSLRSAILSELAAPAPVIPADYFATFSYQNVARCTYSGYARVLDTALSASSRS